MPKIKKISELISLAKPLVIFDLETTGLSVNLDRIIEVAYLKIMPDGKIIKNDLLLNPEMKIPDEAFAVHGISDDKVKDQPTFKDKAEELYEVFSDCSYSGFNVFNYDLPMLKREFLRAGLDFNYANAKIIDAKVIYHHMEPRTLSAAYKFYCKKEHIGAHNALADVEATAKILSKQLEKYEETRDWDFIYKIHHLLDDRFVDTDRKFYWRSGEAYFAFSKHKDRPLAEIAEKDRGFLEWIIGADFSEETKEIARKALNGELPKK
ncbi:3'-5' exonuclease [Candidatus Falkowbacteria bacterium]|nr:3'-5' exonuclease [Candidatus Falkowbacteria bacterium]